MRQGNNNLARAFQAGIESRSRQKKWEEHRFMLLHPPARELTYSQIERRRDMAERWDWLRYPDDVRRRTVEASPQGGKALREIEERQRRASEAAQHREAEIREIQERLEGLRPFQILLKNRLGGELQAEEKALAKAEAEQKRLALDEKKLILSCPDDVVSQYRWRKEEEREKALVALLAREAKEIEAERRREADEAQARKERQAMRPVAKPQKTGGWVPPSPN